MKSSEIDIRTTEALRWSWSRSFIGFLLGGTLYILIYLILETISGPLFKSSNIPVSLYWLRGILAFGSILAVFSGLQSQIIGSKPKPNQGIQLSMRNSLFAALIIGLILPLILAMVESLIGHRLSFSTVMGMMGVWFLTATLLYGGFTVIEHFTLRLILVIRGYIPRNYAAFLDYAVDRILLQKVGGGYRFIHGNLLEHFARSGVNWHKNS